MSEKETKTFIIAIDTNRCKGCGYCKETCPKGVFAFSGELNAQGYAVSSAPGVANCIGCNSCVMVCPDFAITLAEG